ncbi:bifunctional diaminohydroxyphosphoribosylaminopyrimidine deaminase/5-amino-6-(5-phosphoribosylamino)uracil reductase RibD [Limisalsivibrio acetivorans]|uniref:bifunctional diaminohydroxyphosphoribosylaminopyrimidine deaminase/5-amino-6-(5-phosphoribosylamino)uracil reductase RibD n=1 Tax=Limisalsivibrio acetivorans TaxID=1304888 RepID=UPI0003B563A0|nr:bifunctional diaminohydroxyphosphoribosylaminopyrimidine deaminase/5-amino-6-(5-phosphoribosylamino)uracil reductase RibD [Limisalsivibrio acetivorans]
MARRTVNPLDIMDECVQLALGGRGATKTNPIVGSIVVKDGEVIGRGFHEEYGSAHAEVNALNEAGELARGADLYVTLEPCSHQGKTPPCTDRIIQSGIKRVFVGVVDPNPVNAGKGLEKLMEAGLEVFLGYREELCAAVIEDFTKLTLTGKPYFTLKTASTLDGKLATRTGESKWITGSPARAYVHYLRSVSDAVLVGVNTVIADDPALTVRDHIFDAEEPFKIVMDPSGRLPLGCRLLNETPEKLVYVTSPEGGKISEAVIDKGGTVLRPGMDGRYINMDALAEGLVKLGIMNVLIEGGGETAGAFFDSKLIDRGNFFIALKVMGGRDAVTCIGGEGISSVADAYPMIDPEIKRFGEDLLVHGRFTDYRKYVLDLTEKLRNRCSREL